MPLTRDDVKSGMTKGVRPPPRARVPKTTTPSLPGDARVARVQKQLRQAGFNVAVDGVRGPQTDAALRHYNAQVVKQNADVRRGTANIIKTQFAEPRPYQPPRRAIIKPSQYQAQPAHKAPSVRTSYKPFYKGQKPDHFEPKAGPFGVGMDATPGGIAGAVHYGKPVYVLPKAGPAGDPTLAGYSPAQRVELARQHAANTTMLGNLLQSTVHPISDIAKGPSTPRGALSDVVNIASYLPFGAEHLAGAAALFEAAHGKGIFKAVVDAEAPKLATSGAAHQAMEGLKNHSSRLDVHAQIDAQAPTQAAARQTKQKLDNWAIDYANRESKGVPRKERGAVRRQKAMEFYDQVAASSKGTPEDVRPGFAITNRTRQARNEVTARQSVYDETRTTMKNAEKEHGKKSAEYKASRKEFLTASTELGAAKNAHVFSLLTDRADHFGIEALPADHPLAPARRALAEDLWASYKDRPGALPPHVKGPKDLERLTAVLADTMKRGEWGRMWYENSAKEIVKLAGGDLEKADQIAQLFAIYSPQQPILGNTSLAVRAWNEFLTNGRVEAVGTAKQIEKANSILVDKVPWEGRKTNNFYVNFLEDINNGKYQDLANERAAALAKNKGDLAKTQVGREVTADLWMARAFGYARDAVSHGRYDLIEGITRQLADEEGWKPKQAQAAIWTEIKDFSPYDKSANIDFQTGIRHHMAQFNYEAAIGQMDPELQAAFAKLPKGQQNAMMHDLAGAVDRFAQQVGLLHLGSEFGPGVYEGEAGLEQNLGARLQVATSAAPRVGTKVAYDLTPYEHSLMDATAAAIARGLKQNEVAWFRPINALSKEAGHSMLLELDRQATNDEAIKLWEALNPDGKERFAVVHTRGGLFIRNVTEEGKPGHIPNFAVGKNVEHFQQLATDATNSVFPGKPSLFVYAGDGQLIKGAEYEGAVASAFGDGGRSEEALRFRGAADQLAREADVVHQRYLGDAAAGAGAGPDHFPVAEGVPGLDVPHPKDYQPGGGAAVDEFGNPTNVRYSSGGDTFPAHWADTGSGPGLSAVYNDARGWLADVAWSNMDPEAIHELPDDVVAKAVDKYYGGGMDQFIKDSLYVDASGPVPGLDIPHPADRSFVPPAGSGAAFDEFGNPITTRFATGALPGEGFPAEQTLATTHEPVPAITPEEELRQGLRSARSQYGKQKVLRSDKRKQQAEDLNKALRSIADPDEAQAAAADVLRGELPKIDFQGLSSLNDVSLKHLKTFVKNTDQLLPFQKIKLMNSLDKVVKEGRIPPPNEMRLIEHLFGKQTAIGIAKTAAGWGDTVINILNIPRSMMATFDLSAVARQGLVAGTTHPFIWGRSIPTMLRSWRDPVVYERTMQELESDPSYPLALAAGISFTDVSEHAAIGAREEQFASDYAAQALDYVPGVPNVIKASSRAYTVFLNKIRMDLFKNQIRIAVAAGRDIHDEKFLTSLGDVVNASTGRGTIHGRLDHFMPALNTMLFSPRLMLSRINYLDPTWYYRLGTDMPKGTGMAKQVRLEALRGLFATAAAVSTTLYLFSRIPGVTVGSLDPRSADFGKLKIGNTRIDVAAGFQQYIRLAAELATQATVSSTTGKKTKLGSGYGKPTSLDLIIKFAEGKLAPPLAIATNIARGQDAVGNPVTPESIATSNFVPLILQDAHDIYKEHHGGVNGIEWALAGFGLGAFGLGIQTYDPRPVKNRQSHSSDTMPSLTGSSGGPSSSMPSLSGGGSTMPAVP